jgi:hypothetical protein
MQARLRELFHSRRLSEERNHREDNDEDEDEQ